MFSKFILLYIALLISVFSVAQSTKKYNSLFWEISGNGLSKPSYLYGTMHVSNKVAFHLSDSFFIAIKNVDVVGVETNPEKWMEELYAEKRNDVEITKNNPQSTNSFYKNCFYLNIPTNRELKGVLKYYPQIVNSLLYRKREGQDNFEENTYLDLFILQSGRKYGKQIASLENYRQSQMLVDKAQESIDENEEDQISYAKKSKLLKGMSYTDLIEDAYRRGDLDFMDSISKIFYPSKNYTKYMLEIRNEIMVKNMDSIMRLQSLFTGVGAAHLPGDKGVIYLLIQKGYKVRPIFLNSGLESKFKEEVEKINYPVNFETYTDVDSLFSIEVPGKMYEVAKTKSYKYYLHPDMANGCFYMVMTVQNYAALLGMKPSDYMKKVDSLLFENIPGKILKKTPLLTNNGWSGYDIENQTKRGDYQYYKIIFSPTQLIVVKVNGNAEYAKGKEAQHFLNSLKFLDPKTKLFKVHEFPEYGASVYMPERLHKQSNRDYNYRTFAHFIANGLDENQKQYTFIRSAYHDFKYMEEDTFELNVLAENFCKEQSMKLISKKIMDKTRYPSLRFTATYQNSEFQGRITISQPFYYLQLTNAKDKNAEKFITSLQLNEIKVKESFQEFVDSTLFFRVNTITMMNKEKKHLSPYEEKKPKNGKKEPEAKKYYFSRSHYYSSVNTNECVMIDVNRFSKYSNVENADTFWVRRAEKYTYGKDLILKSKQIEKKDYWQEAYFVYADTNTNQCINVRAILKGEVIYIIRTNSDSLTQRSKFVTEFFRTFTPTDTFIGKGIFVSKANDFFEDIYSKDKSTQLGAQDAVENNDVDFFAEDDTIILRNIRKPDFHSLTLRSKVNIIRGLTNTKNETVAAELKKLYEDYTDSTEIQLVLLQTLADLKTAASTKILLELLINDTPPLETQQEAMDILYPYFDSLALTKHLYPKILDLTRYSEYKYAIHKLLAYAVYENVLTKEIYASYKPILFKECKDELKRQFSMEKEEISYFSKSIDNDMFVDSKSKPAEKNVFREESNKQQSYFGNDHLYALAILIEPFLNETGAKQIITKMQNINGLRTRSSILTYMLSKGHTFPDSVLNKLSSSEESRTYFYKRLKKYEKENIFDKKYLNQKDFAYALIFGNMKLDKKEDTVVFVEKRDITIKNRKGSVYFYKLKQKKDNNYTIHAAGLFPDNSKQVVTSDDLYLDTKEIEKGDREKELIDEMLQQARYRNRKRASYSNSYF
ncbi:MAG: TraB/GumN family protein [Bacteroidota bacterium]|nr:TraB/GumN family protein [Bacteroidota bacterium]